eukprot:GEMP01021829.1.p1 GENE.GEMP01021829.1~~GEMP01021829.1.p1  ORF type:complete len:564 (+),score=106.28 GEMP01021829.1:64-1755(+)
MEQALEAFRNGGFVMVMDSADRENECDLVIAAETCTNEKMAFLIRHSTGIVCVVSDQERLESMGLHPATGLNTDKNGTNFYVSTDYLVGTTTGVCASDRVATIKAMCNDKLNPEEFSKPGHMFPLSAKKRGVLEREGHTESAYDLCRLSGITRVASIGEMMHDDGTMYRYQDSIEFAKKHNIPLITVQDIIDARKAQEAAAKPAALSVSCPKSSTTCKINIFGIADTCNLRVYESDGAEVVVLIKGDVAGKTNVPVRVHSECFTGDTFGSQRCDCGKQLEMFKDIMSHEPQAILAYQKGHEGRGIGLANKIACYKVQDEEKLDTVDANLRLGFEVDQRSFAPVIGILNDIGVRSIKLYTNNPAKVLALSSIIESTATLASVPTRDNLNYLQTKVDRMGHATVLSTFDILTPPGVGQQKAGKESTIAIVSTIWNEYYVKPIVEECVAWLRKNNIRVLLRTVPGALDLVSGARTMVNKHDPGAVIALGVLMQGASDTYQHTCSAVLNGISSLNANQDVPIVAQVLMVKNDEQAKERAFEEQLGAALAKSALSMLTIWKDEELQVP